MMAGDSEWFEANVPVAQMSQEEKDKTGLPKSPQETSDGYYGPLG